jgi:hypothetical protein
LESSEAQQLMLFRGSGSLVRCYGECWLQHIFQHVAERKGKFHYPDAWCSYAAWRGSVPCGLARKCSFEDPVLAEQNGLLSRLVQAAS